MTIPTFFALVLLLVLYVVLRISSNKPDKRYVALCDRTGKRGAKALVSEYKKRYPRQRGAWIYRKILNDLDKGKV